MATPHIESELSDIAKIVLMPGDPLRAKRIAENFLTDYKQVNGVRNALAYTGYYKGKRVTVFASGMGIPSMGIYSYELFNFYDVDVIIRIGSAGAYTEDLDLFELVLVDGSYSESTFAKTQSGELSNILYSTKEINDTIESTAQEIGIKINKGNVHSTDVFYGQITDIDNLYNEHHCLAVEMETFALFQNAKLLNKKAAAIVTISDNLITKVETTSEQRQNSFTSMVKLALESAIKL
jgi:purine-nucleoside phosphorylase